MATASTNLPTLRQIKLNALADSRKKFLRVKINRQPEIESLANVKRVALLKTQLDELNASIKTLGEEKKDEKVKLSELKKVSLQAKYRLGYQKYKFGRAKRKIRRFVQENREKLESLLLNKQFKKRAKERKKFNSEFKKLRFDKKISTELLNDFCCLICTEPLVDVRLIKCGHLACNMCLTKWRKRDPKAPRRLWPSLETCPICRTRIEEAAGCRPLDGAIKYLVSNAYDRDAYHEWLALREKYAEELVTFEKEWQEARTRPTVRRSARRSGTVGLRTTQIIQVSPNYSSNFEPNMPQPVVEISPVSNDELADNQSTMDQGADNQTDSRVEDLDDTEIETDDDNEVEEVVRYPRMMSLGAVRFNLRRLFTRRQ